MDIGGIELMCKITKKPGRVAIKTRRNPDSHAKALLVKVYKGFATKQDAQVKEENLIEYGIKKRDVSAKALRKLDLLEKK